jgi:hypothetical protein
MDEADLIRCHHVLRRTQQEAIDNAEHHRIRPNAAPEDQYDGRRESRLAADRAKGQRKRAQDRVCALAPLLLLRCLADELFERPPIGSFVAKGSERLPHAFLFGEAALHAVAHSLLEVKRQLIVYILGRSTTNESKAKEASNAGGQTHVSDLLLTSGPCIRR